jgi:hypothetical protein
MSLIQSWNANHATMTLSEFTFVNHNIKYKVIQNLMAKLSGVVAETNWSKKFKQIVV